MNEAPYDFVERRPTYGAARDGCGASRPTYLFAFRSA